MFSFLLNKLVRPMHDEFIQYNCPRNMTYFWNFGVLSLLFLVVQLISGLFLTFYYEPNILHAFDSIDYIVREVQYGWFIRSMHTTGASFFFFFLYLHMVRGFYYRLYVFPRTVVWVVGLITYLLLIVSAFLGYVLPWGQMSYWAATVITKLVTSLPYFGNDLLYWIWGGFSINNATLSRFFTLHFITPFLLTGFVIIHIFFFHSTGSSVELGLSPNLAKQINKVIPFHSYYTRKDFFVCFFVLIFFFLFCFFFPEFFNHTDNYNYADSMVTPDHIVPEWYFLPFYGILRSVYDKSYGIIITLFSLLGFFFIPLVGANLPVRWERRYNFIFLFWILVLNFFLLGIIGGLSPVFPVIELGLFCIYIHLLIIYVIFPYLISIDRLLTVKDISDDFNDEDIMDEYEWIENVDEDIRDEYLGYAIARARFPLPRDFLKEKRSTFKYKLILLEYQRPSESDVHHITDKIL